MIAITLLAYLSAAFISPQIGIPGNVDDIIWHTCPDATESCFITTIDAIWLKASIEERSIICQYLQKSDSRYARSYLIKRLEAEKESLSLYLLLNALINKHSPDDIPFLCRMMPNSISVGREGDLMSDVILDYFQYSIPIEYRFHRERFSKSKKYRELIARKYMKWFSSLSQPVRWVSKYDCYMINENDQKEAEQRKSWEYKWCQVFGFRFLASTSERANTEDPAPSLKCN